MFTVRPPQPRWTARSRCDEALAASFGGDGSFVGI